MKKKAIILGAGISGLTLAWYLSKVLKNWEIIILEKENRVGGWIKTDTADGMLFEHGPRSFRLNKTIKLFDELGLSNQLLYASTKTKYLAYQQRLEPIPENFLSLFTTPLGRKLLRALTSYPLSYVFRKKNREDETLSDFFGKRFGHECIDLFIDPLMAGIYAAHPSTLSREACLPKFSRKMQVCSFREGMQQLPNALAHQLQIQTDIEICLNTNVLAIHERTDSVCVEHTRGAIQGDMLFSTIPSIKNLIPQDDPLHFLLPPVIRNSVIIVGLGFREPLLLNGFGFLASSQEEKELLGIVFDSVVFPEQNGEYPIRLSVMMGGDRAPYLMDATDSQLQQLAQTFCKKYLKIFSEPNVCRITRADQGIPSYPVGHVMRLQRLEEHLQRRRIVLLGTALYGVSLGNCIAQAEIVAMAFAKNSRYSYMWEID